MISFFTIGNIAIIFFFGVAMLIYPKKKKYHYWVAFSFMAGALTFLLDLLFFKEKIDFTSFFLIYFPLEYSMGPLLFFMLHNMIYSDKKTNKLYYILFIVPIFIFLYNLLVRFIFQNESIILITQSIYYSLEVWSVGCLLLFFIPFFQDLKDQNHTKVKNFRFYIIYLVFWVIWLIAIGIIYLSNIVHLLELMTFLASTLCLIFLIYHIRNPAKLFLLQESIESVEKYKKSSLKLLNTTQIIKKLTFQMNTKKVYTDENLNLEILSESLEIKSHQLSELLNKEMKTSFNNYVNHYRNNHAKKMLLENLNESILFIAFESGFNSKSSFNSIFKKLNNMTPKEYRSQKNVK